VLKSIDLLLCLIVETTYCSDSAVADAVQHIGLNSQLEKCW
jgi:hypothetical protein